MSLKKAITIKDLKTASFVAGLDGREYTKMIERLLAEVGLNDLYVAMRVSNWESIQEAARVGIGVAVLPLFAIDRDRKYRTINELTVRGVDLKADIMLIEQTHRRFVSPSVALVKNALVSGLSRHSKF